MAGPIRDQIRATIYGQCIGDALGLLTEFMEKRETKVYYGNKPTDLKYGQKVPDFHRSRWSMGDWTDDTDQMILILHSLLYNKGRINQADFAQRLHFWMKRGFPEFGDFAGMGIGMTTSKVLNHPEFCVTPEEVAKEVWEASGCKMAPNGSVMRTSILGLYQWTDLEAVKNNALAFGKTTHFDYRCQASVIAVTTSIALMLQRTAENMNLDKPRKLDVDKIILQSYEAACSVLETEEQKQELWKFMSIKKLKDLDLSEKNSIGYTYKCMGSGFWALKKDNFQKSLIKLIMEGGDADTNGCVAGAMLACKLGLAAIPQHWISELQHKDFMDGLIEKFLTLQTEIETKSIEEITEYEDLSLDRLRERANEIQKEREKQWADERKKKEEERLKKEGEKEG